MILDFDGFQTIMEEFFDVFLQETQMSDEEKRRLYQDYAIRENQLEDYLDIFRGRNTRAERQFMADVPHRFEALLENKHQVRFLLIAEAAPNNGNYIYSDARGAWITAPLNAFNTPNVTDLNAEQRLSALAANGIVILDLFPFNFPFGNNGGALRDLCMQNGTTGRFFLDENNQYSVNNRVNYLVESIPNCNFNPDINTAFMATPLINRYLSANYQGIDYRHLRIQRGLNQLVGGYVQNSSGNQYVLGGLANLPEYCADCSCGSGSPHATLIRSALNL